MDTGLKCPKCGGEIMRGEPRCAHCGVGLKWRSPAHGSAPRNETPAVPGAITVRLPPPPSPPSPGTGEGPKFCSHCGGKLEPGQRFCPGCGAQAGGGAAPRRGLRMPATNTYGVPEGMRPLLPDERAPGFLAAWGRGWRPRFSGRASRKEFWLRFLGSIIEGAVVFAIAMMVYQSVLADNSGGYWYSSRSAHAEATAAATRVASVFGLVVFFPWMALMVRRCHDCGVHGIVGVVIWLLSVPWMLVGGWGIPFCEPGPAMALNVISGILALVFALIPGQGGPNKWGPDPHARFTPKTRFSV